MKTTRRGIFKLIAGAAACIALPVPKWHKPEPTFKFSREIPPPLNKEEFAEVYPQPKAPNMQGTGQWGERPEFWREKILKLYPNRPSELMTILGKLRKP